MSRRRVLFVSDIDETLRDNVHGGRPLRGAVTLLRAVRDLEVPIVYLTAGSVAIRRMNRAFLYDHGFPRGQLVHRPLDDQRPNADFKDDILRGLQREHPGTVLACLGDNETGDAIAYHRQCTGGSFIRTVRPWEDGDNRDDDAPSFRLDASAHRCLPRGTGRLEYLRGYTAEVRACILDNLRSLIAGRTTRQSSAAPAGPLRPRRVGSPQ